MTSDARYYVSYFTSENAGTYYCIADNGQQAIEKFEVSVKSANPPSIQISPRTVDAYEGSSVSFNLSLSGSQPIQIKVQLYSAQSQPVSGIYVNQAENRIEIRQVTRDMQGQYIVEASNDYGTAQDYFALRVLESKYF